MTDPDERWLRVAAAIRARMEGPPGIGMAELVRASKVSDTSIYKYLEGAPIVRKEKRRGLCVGLRWTPDSIDRILEGGEPVELPSENVDPLLASLIERMDRYEEGFDKLKEDVSALLERLREVLPAAPPNGPSAHPEQ